MHLHDCGLDKHPHIALGSGIVDVDGSIRRLPKDGTCLVEVKTIEGLEKSVAYLKNKNFM
jgi:sugar phosphate isomerase/epimerase